MSRRRPTRLRLTALEDRLTPAGGLDPTFGTGGIVQAATTGGDSRAQVAFQPDGRLLVLSHTGASPIDPGYGASDEIARFLPDGTPDAGFGVNGRAAPLAGRLFARGSMAVAPDGKIVLFGNSMATGEWYGHATVVRLNADGSLDTTFGVGGSVVSAHLPSLNSLTGSPTDLVVRPDGSIVVAGGDLGRLVVTRLDSTGAVDPAFGTGGRFVQPQLGASTQLSAVNASLLPNGGVVAAGDYTDYTNPITPGVTEVVTELTSGGAVDTSFSGDGVWSSAVEGLGVVTGGWSALAVQPDGKLILTGVGPAGAGGQHFHSLVAFRLNADGSADTGFGTNGQTVVQDDEVYGGYVSLGLLSDGRIVVGASRNLLSAGGTVSVLNPDGTPDDYFADGSGRGQVVYGPGGLNGPTSVGDIAVFDDRVAVVSSVYDSSTIATLLGSKSSLGLAVLAERPDALPTYTPPVAVTPPQPPVLVGPPVFTDPGVLPIPYEHVVLIDVPAPVEQLRPWDNDGPGGNPLVETVLPTFVSPASGDVNGDGVTDKIVTAGSTVSVVSGTDGSVLVKPFAPFEASYTGALNAVLVDIGGSGRAALVVSPGQGGGPVVAVYNADGTERGRFWGIDDPDFRGGVNLTVSYGLFVTAGQGGGPRVAVFDTATLGADARRLTADFFALESDQRGGVVATQAGGVILFAAGPGGGPRVRAFDSSAMRDTAFTSLDDLPAKARTFDKFIGDPNARNGVTLDVRPTGVVLDASNPRGFRQEVTTDSGSGPQEVVYPFDEYDIREVHPLSSHGANVG